MRRVSIALVGLLLVAGCGTSSSPAGAGGTPRVAGPPGASAAATSPAAAGPHDPADAEFVRALIPHHERGIALARQAVKNPGAQTLAEAIIVTQQDEIVRMTAWLTAWGEPAPPSTSTGPPPATSAGPPPAASAGPPPAGDPIGALIGHQQEAIELAQREQAGGANPSALAFARQIIESRTGQIDQLRALQN